MLSVQFRTAFVEMDEWNIFSTFNDGKKNHFYIPAGTSIETANLYGYTDLTRYTLEHELCHHFIADNLGWKWSWSIHSSAGKIGSDFKGPWPNHIEWEENLVNAFQNYCHTGTRDKWQVLHCVFPDEKLERKKEEFLKLTRKSLDNQLNIMYNHESGKITEL